jgi:hypothetical protein
VSAIFLGALHVSWEQAGYERRDLGAFQSAWQAFLRRALGAKQVVRLIGRYARDCVDSRWVMVDVVD